MPAFFRPWEHGMPASTPWSATSFNQERCFGEPVFEDWAPAEREELGAVEQTPQEDSACPTLLDVAVPGGAESTPERRAVAARVAERGS